jgi:hypothetical protein
MPFGTKPRGPEQTPHDFDKIYRVVIKRAVERAGMQCIRADETKGSRLIHTDMFLDLRDQPLVIADLSLQNANVFYELGVRHVMSSTGTVLMCEKGSMPLPFDIGLSRVVPYEYDGKNLDYEEAERLVELLRAALIESATGAADSPVHAMLERVLSDTSQGTPVDSWGGSNDTSERRDDLVVYEQLIASIWRDDGADLSCLFEEHCTSTFGCRALARFVLAAEPFPFEESSRIASQLSDLSEFALAAEIFQRLHETGHATQRDLMGFANAYSESHPNVDGADHALQIVAEAERMTDVTDDGALATREEVATRAHCRRREAGLRQWRWQLSQDPSDLGAAITAQGEAIELLETAQRLGQTGLSSLVAQSRLKRMVLLRRQADDPHLTDSMADAPAVLAIRPEPDADAKHNSYLRWYRTIALADIGAADRVQQSALEAFAKDADLMNDSGSVEIGRRQYAQLRRFLEEYSKWLRHPELVGIIGQTLQARR